jgi:DNA polymerase-1
MADLAKDDAYIDFFNNGDGDAHSFVATKMFSTKFNKDFIVTKTNENKSYRQKGKVLNFSISFGSSAFSIAKKLHIDVKEAQELVNSFFEGFPGLNKFFKRTGEFGLKYGYIRTNGITNRIRWFPEWKKYLELKDSRYLNKEQHKEKLQIEGRIKRKSSNTRIQGTSADMTKTALILLRNELLNAGIKPFKTAEVKIVNVIHDEILIECNQNSISWSDIQKKCMEQAASIYCKRVTIPATPVIKKHWTH